MFKVELYILLMMSRLKNRIILLCIFFPVLISLVLLFASCKDTQQPVNVNNLQCEYLSNPLGIDCKNPRFSWQLKSKENPISQKAYKLFIGTDSADVSRGIGDQWESGTISCNTIPAIYSGTALEAFTRYYWGVKVKDNNGHWTPLSKVSWFETGMMGQDNWKGDWITDTHDYTLRAAALFRKSIQIEKPVESARAYIAVGGCMNFC